MGRPPKSEEDKLMERVVVLFTKSQFQDLLEFEADKGIREHAQTIRDLVLAKLKRHKAEKNKSSDKA